MPHVLVVDDEEGAVETLGYILESEGFETTPAMSGAAALAALAVRTFDVVLLDIVMPDADGLELCQEIRGRYPATPVILMTGYYADTVINDVERMVGVQLLHKPLQITELLCLCREMVAAGVPIAGGPAH
jgi:CheY-like chemotaxis protein